MLDRRTFLTRSLQAAAAAQLASFDSFAWQTVANVGEMYRQAVVIDSLGGTQLKVPLDAKLLQKVVSSGITAVNWTVSERDLEDTLQAIGTAYALVDAAPDNFAIIRRVDDIAAAKRAGKIGFMLGFQYTTPLEGNGLDRFDTFRNLGVRIMQLTYNVRSLFGDGCMEPNNGELSNLGRAAVAKMNEIGIAIDLSHSGKRTTSEAIALSKKPVLITHSGCNAVYAHPRNKDDEDMRALANKGGYFGVYLMPYLTPSPVVPTRADVTKHLTHALNVCGEDHVGIGTDGSIEGRDLTPADLKAFQEDVERRKRLGIGAPGEDRMPFVPELNSPRRMEIIASDLLKAGYPARVAEKVLGANFVRALQQIW
jgi:membrane dipeptidase